MNYKEEEKIILIESSKAQTPYNTQYTDYNYNISGAIPGTAYDISVSLVNFVFPMASTTSLNSKIIRVYCDLGASTNQWSLSNNTLLLAIIPTLESANHVWNAENYICNNPIEYKINGQINNYIRIQLMSETDGTLITGSAAFSATNNNFLQLKFKYKIPL